MERLTRRSANGTGIYATPSGDPVKWEDNYHNVLQKLADYEDLEEQGRLISLPCKVGDTVYHVVQGRIVEVSNVDLFFLLLSVAENRFNNSVFLTKSEAEQKLKEMENK